MAGAQYANLGEPPAGNITHRYRHSWFLLSLIATIVLAPIVEQADIANVAYRILFTIVVLLALNTVTDRRSHLIVAAACAASWLILDWAAFLSGQPSFQLPAGIALICLLFVVLSDIMLLLFRVRRTDLDVLSGAVGAYLLLGVAWAASFDLLERIMPGSFDGLDSQRWSEFLYFSMQTLTTLGYGDISPTNPIAGIWATLEAACGVLYIAVLISRLVSLLRD